MTLHIRAEAPGDIAAVRAVHATAFPTDAEARLVDALRAAGQAAVSLVALVQDDIVGHVLFSPVAANSGRGVGLAPVAVLPRDQGQGIGAALIRTGIEACRAAGYDYVVVLGDPGYYRRFGFRRALDLGLQNEYGAQDEFMVLELRPGGLAGVTGMLKYCGEFAALA